MTDVMAQGVATLLAAFAAGGMVLALFYPVHSESARAASRLATLTAVRKSKKEESAEALSAVIRVHEAALKVIAENKRTRRVTRLSGRLEAAGLRCSQSSFIAGCVTLSMVSFLVAMSAQLPVLFAISFAVVCCWILPLRVLAFLAARRRLKFLAAFTPAVDMVVRGAKSGLAVADCLNIVAEDADPLIRKEFAAIAVQLRAGVPLPEAVARLSAVMPAPEVRFFVLIMSTQSQTGGNLSDALGNLAGVLRDRQRLASKVRTASAEAKASAIFIGVLLPVVIGATMAVSPDYIRVLWTTGAGQRIVMYSAVWLIIGVMVLRRMARIEP